MASLFKALRLHSRREFVRVMEHVSHEVCRAHTHREAWRAIDSAISRYPELHQAAAFWTLTRRAHMDVVVLRLARLYDAYPGVASLGNLLMTFRQSVSQAGTVVPSEIANLSTEELDKDVASLSEDVPAISRLLKVRHNYLAHRNGKEASTGSFDSNRIESEDLDLLLTNAMNVIDKYRRLFGLYQLGPDRQAIREFQELLEYLKAGMSSPVSSDLDDFLSKISQRNLQEPVDFDKT